MGVYPGFGRRDDGIDLFESTLRNKIARENFGKNQGEVNQIFTIACENARNLIREWIIAQGLSEKETRRASEYVLKNAFKSGSPYVKKMIQSENEKRGGRGQAPNTRYNPKDAIDVDIDLGNLLNTPGVGNTPQAPKAPEKVEVRVSEDQIREVAAKIINPQIGTAVRELNHQITREIENLTPTLSAQIKAEVDQLELGQHMTSEITRIAEIAAKQMAETMLPRRIEIMKPIGEIVGLKHEPRHHAFEEILKWLLVGSHVYIVGPKGTGKTHMGEQLGEALRIAWDRPDLKVFFIDQSLTKYDVKGYKGPDGKYIGTLVRRCVEEGGLLFIDEGDSWAAAALMSLNSILANKFGAFPDDIVQVHKDFRCVLAANTSGHGATQEYNAGRNPLDPASLDRFSEVEMPYDKELEAQIYGKTPWVEYVWRIREVCEDLGKPSLAPSMRAIEMGLKGLAGGLTIQQVMKARIFRSTPKDEVDMILHHAGEPPRLREVA